MKKKQQLLALGIVILVLIASSVTYFVVRKASCNTNGIRPSSCKPANNRCLPPGDSREAVVDCAEFKYYQAAN